MIGALLIVTIGAPARAVIPHPAPEHILLTFQGRGNADQAFDDTFWITMQVNTATRGRMRVTGNDREATASAIHLNRLPEAQWRAMGLPLASDCEVRSDRRTGKLVTQGYQREPVAGEIVDRKRAQACFAAAVYHHFAIDDLPPLDQVADDRDFARIGGAWYSRLAGVAAKSGHAPAPGRRAPYSSPRPAAPAAGQPVWHVISGDASSVILADDAAVRQEADGRRSIQVMTLLRGPSRQRIGPETREIDCANRIRLQRPPATRQQADEQALASFACLPGFREETGRGFRLFRDVDRFAAVYFALLEIPISPFDAMHFGSLPNKDAAAVFLTRHRPDLNALIEAILER